MSSLLVSDRTSILAAKRQESRDILAHRTLKLQQLYCITTAVDLLNLTSLSPNHAEVDFLEQNSLSLGRKFDASTLPKFQHFSANARVDATKAPSSSSSVNASEDNVAFQRNGDAVHDKTTKAHAPFGVTRGHLMTPRENTTALLQDSATIVVKDALSSIRNESSALQDLGLSASETQRILPINESRPNSPGVNPQQVIPMSADDQAHLPNSITIGAHGPNHKAATVHLPSKEIQEERLKNQDHATAMDGVDSNEKDSSIQLPPHGSKRIDAISSPSSTIGAHSIATPALHDTSTDTSPDHERPQYASLNRSQKHESPLTPPEIAPSAKDIRNEEDHGHAVKNAPDLVHSEALGDSPEEVDAQLHLEVEQAAAASSSATQERTGTQDQSLTKMPTTTESKVTPDLEVDAVDAVDGVIVPRSGLAREPKTLTAQDNVQGPSDVDTVDVDGSLSSGSGVLKEQGSYINSSKTTSHVNDISSPAAKPDPHPDSLLTKSRTPPSFERMNTRISSGAMRHKSVSEILGEGCRPPIAEKSEKGVDENSKQSTRSGSPQSPDSRARSIIDRARDKERSKLSTVVFARKPLPKPSTNTVSSSNGSKSQSFDNADYFMPLVRAQAYTSTRGVRPMDDLLISAHKTITTSNAYVPFHDHQTTKVLKRVFNMQREDKWSFRQPVRGPEPIRPTTHRDEFLKEMRWMRTDFREERKWKMAVARNLACACAEWVKADAEDRWLLQVKASPPKEKTDVAERAEGTPDLMFSNDHDSPANDFDDEISTSMVDAIAPTAMFSLQDDELVFGLVRGSAAAEKVLQELPMYGTPLQVPQSDLPTSEIDPDASWRHEAMPLSRYVEGKIVLKDDGPPRKKSRYSYEEESEEEEETITRGVETPAKEKQEFHPVEVALFNPENKHIRDRIQAGHQFRPPSENPMPSQSFFENRSSSQWLFSEEDELKALVREYSYNWQLISSVLSTRSLFASGADRRTPWECFERWIYLEGLPADMSKTHYFRAYNHRLEAAQRTLINQATQAAQQAAQQANGATPAAATIRRRTTTGIRVERKRNQKHLTLVETMRKLAKKREAAQQKHAHAQNLASVKKESNNPAPHSQGKPTTPQDFSKIKHDREIMLAERMARLQQQQEAQRRAMLQARNGQVVHQNIQQQYNANGVPHLPRPPGPPGHPTATQQPLPQARPNNLTVPGQVPHGSMPPPPHNSLQVPMASGHAGSPQIPMKVPQAQMQNLQNMQNMQNMQNAQRLQGVHPQQRQPPAHAESGLNVVMQARSISEQQRQAIAQQQHQGHQGRPNPQMHNSPSGMRPPTTANGGNSQAFLQNNQNLIQNFNGSSTNGNSTPPANGYNINGPGQVGSPRMQPPATASSQHNTSMKNMSVSNIEAQFRSANPNATSEQVTRHVADTINKSSNPTRTNAMMAAAGLTGNTAGLPNYPPGGHSSPQAYAQMLRAHQMNQASVQKHAQEQAAHQLNTNSVQRHAQDQTQQQAQAQAQQGHIQVQAGQQHRSASVNSATSGT